MSWYNPLSWFDSDEPQTPPAAGPAGNGSIRTGGYNPEKLQATMPFDRNAFDFNSTCYPIDLLSPNSPYGDNYMVFYINVHEDSVFAKSAMSADERMAAGLAPAQRGYLDGSVAGRPEKNIAATTTVVAGGAAMGVKAALAAGTVGMIGGPEAAITAAAGVETAVVNYTNNLVSSTNLGNRASFKLSRQAIALYVPQISTVYQTEWMEQELGTAEESMSMAQDFGNNLSPGRVASRAAEGLQYIALSQALNAAGAEMGNAILKASGTQFNPKKEQLFNNVKFRRHLFNYTFAPRNLEEARNVITIVNLFKLHMMPEFRDNTNQWMYIYPSEFDICIYNSGSENIFMPKYTSCALTDCTVNYKDPFSQQFQTFDNVTANGDIVGGMPAYITLQLNFLELAQLSRENIQAGF